MCASVSKPLIFENPLLLHTYIYEVTLNAMFFDILYVIVMESTIKSLCQRRDRSPYQFRARGGRVVYFFQKKMKTSNVSICICKMYFNILFDTASTLFVPSLAVLIVL
jgi:hypothetical protein